MRKLIVVFVFVLCSSVYGGYFFEGSVNLGYTIVDLDELVEKTENTGADINDWNQLSYGINLSYYFLNINSFHFGVSVDYMHSFWYSVDIPYGSQPIYREYDKKTTSISPIIKLDCPNGVFISASPVFILSDSLNLGASISGGYYLGFGRILIPVAIRVDLRNCSVPYYPLLLQMGIRHNL